MTTFGVSRVADPEIQRALDELLAAVNFIAQAEFTGTGTPEGAVAAPVGSRYRRIDGGAGTSNYFKETGTGNTGWVGK